MGDVENDVTTADVAGVPAAEIPGILEGMTAAEFNATLRMLLDPERAGFFQAAVGALTCDQVLAATRAADDPHMQELGHITDRELLLDCERSTDASQLNSRIPDTTREAVTAHLNGLF